MDAHIADYSGTPRSCLPVNTSSSGDHRIFGMFTIRHGTAESGGGIFDCSNTDGVCVPTNRDLAWTVYSQDAVAGEGIETVELIVEFEKVLQAKQYWSSLS
jgi:hypothetical protein